MFRYKGNGHRKAIMHPKWYRNLGTMIPVSLPCGSMIKRNSETTNRFTWVPGKIQTFQQQKARKTPQIESCLAYRPPYLIQVGHQELQAVQELRCPVTKKNGEGHKTVQFKRNGSQKKKKDEEELVTFSNYSNAKLKIQFSLPNELQFLTTSRHDQLLTISEN